MKRKLIIALMIMIATSLVACSEPNEVTENTSIDTSIDTSIEPEIVEEIEEELREWDTINDYDVVYVDGEGEDNGVMIQTEGEFNPDTIDVPDISSQLEVTDEPIEIAVTEKPEPTIIPTTESKPEITTSTTPTIIPTTESKPDTTKTPTIIPTTESKPDLTENNIIPEPVGAWHNYKGRNVLELYAVNFEEFTMQQYNVSIIGNENSSSVNEIINTLTDYKSPSSGTKGYFIKTKNTNDNGYEKDYVLLDNSNTINSNTILTNGLNEVKNSPKYASWLVHMGNENIESIKIMNSDIESDLKIITDTDKINTIANYLKSSLPVTQYNNDRDGSIPTIPASNGGTEYTHVFISFNNGVEYEIKTFNHKTFEVFTSDLNRIVEYTIDESVSLKLDNFLQYYFDN